MKMTQLNGKQILFTGYHKNTGDIGFAAWEPEENHNTKQEHYLLRGELEGKGKWLCSCKFERKCDGMVLIFAYYADELYDIDKSDVSDDDEAYN